MAVIRDMMPAFELFQPADVDGALALLSRYGGHARVLGGGLDSFDWLKDRAKRPEVVVDLGMIDELKGIQANDEGLDIGAMTVLTEIAEHPEIVARYTVLAEAAGLVATPQIRNQGTLGGNIAQDTRCWYYRSGWPCYRAGGNVCYASTPVSMNREHCIFGADRCVAVSPSDTAPALIVLDAQMVIRSARGERAVDAANFFIGPATDITRMTVLRPNDLLTRVHVPAPAPGTRFYFEKVADRRSWDFALVNVASAILAPNGAIQHARLVVGGVAPQPLRLPDVERWLIGRPPDEDTALAAGNLAVQDARPLRHNEYKIDLMRNLVKRAVIGE
jgi:xanthine dehydrogenase YagS FAD-binding subunit